MGRKKKTDETNLMLWLVEYADNGKIRTKTFDNEEDALAVYHDLKEKSPNGYVAMNKNVRRLLLG